jgi:hypothetical protein
MSDDRVAVPSAPLSEPHLKSNKRLSVVFSAQEKGELSAQTRVPLAKKVSVSTPTETSATKQRTAGNSPKRVKKTVDRDLDTSEYDDAIAASLAATAAPFNRPAAKKADPANVESEVSPAKQRVVKKEASSSVPFQRGANSSPKKGALDLDAIEAPVSVSPAAGKRANSPKKKATTSDTDSVSSVKRGVVKDNKTTSAAESGEGGAGPVVNRINASPKRPTAQMAEGDSSAVSSQQNRRPSVLLGGAADEGVIRPAVKLSARSNQTSHGEFGEYI